MEKNGARTKEIKARRGWVYGSSGWFQSNRKVSEKLKIYFDNLCFFVDYYYSFFNKYLPQSYDFQA